MNRLRLCIVILLPLVVTVSALAVSPDRGAADEAAWHHPLYLAGHGHWRARAEVTIDNHMEQERLGRPIELIVGDGANELAMVGADARSIRVCNASGSEMLFRLLDAAGNQQRTGAVAAGSRLMIPVVCGPEGSAKYFVYFDNPQAGQVPDYLPLQGALVNGGFEAGDGGVPAGWRHDPGDPAHTATWTAQEARSGDKSAKTVVAPGAEPTWISTRQRGIAIDGGSTYRIRAWAKAENVDGYAGWYVHVGNDDDRMMLAPTLRAGGGTYDWKKVERQFTAPDGADRLDVGTVLRGTGTAWFDDVEIECLTPRSSRFTVTVPRPQRCALAVAGRRASWHEMPNGDDAKAAPAPSRRARLIHVNFAEKTEGTTLLEADMRPIRARLGLVAQDKRLVVFGPQGRRPLFASDEKLLFQSATPPRSVASYYVYALSETRDSKAGAHTAAPADRQAENAGPSADALSRYAALCNGPQNMVDNPSYERGETMPTSWSTTASMPEGVEIGLVESSLSPLGRRCARLHVPKGTPAGWRGLSQSVRVRPGTRYLLAAWVRCADVDDGEVKLHAHFHNAQGGRCAENPFRSSRRGIKGTTGWTLLTGVLPSPPDAATMSLHFTTEHPGTIWYDGAVVAEVETTQWAGVEGVRLADDEAVHLWPVNALIKVFPDEPPPTCADDTAVSAENEADGTSASSMKDVSPPCAVPVAPVQGGATRLTLARNEKEPLQLAVRTGRSPGEVRVEVAPPVGPGGARLAEPEIGVVDFVPMDQASGYFRSDAPSWQRRVPTHGGHTDGWAGLWPDPILPVDRFPLEAGVTRPVWITFSADREAAPGVYRTRVRLVRGEQTLAEAPVELRVWDFALPEQSHVKAIYDVRRGRGGHHWHLEGEEFHRTVARMMTEYRLCPDSVGASIDVRFEGDEPVIDFSEFDEAASFCFNELKLPHAYFPWDFYLFGWGHPPHHRWGEKPYAGEGELPEKVAAGLRPEFKRRYQKVLRKFWNHAKEKGWHEKLIFYISDEPFFREEHIIKQMQALCDMVHEVDPAIPIYSSTWHYVPEWEGYLDVWGVGHYGRITAEQLQQIRRQGDRLWFTTDGQMCTDTPYCAVERLLPHHCFHYGAEAYEFWGYSWLTYDPYEFGWHSFIHQSMRPGESFYTRYPSGDGFMVYPGHRFDRARPVPTIRVEQAREGVEDYEYFWLLRQRMDRAKAAGRDVAEAEALLKRAAELVEMPNAGGRYSTRILPEPGVVLQLKQDLARAIESLR
jgi:hypothetical protein